MGLATEIASAVGTALPLGRVAEALYAKAIEDEPEFAKKDFSAVYQYLGKLGESS